MKMRLLFFLVLVGCTSSGRVSETNAKEHVAFLANLAKNDVAEISRGLPAGAQKLAALYANGADPAQDLASIRRGLARIRREVPDLTAAKSTFFALADKSGTVLRNDLEQDAMAGRSLSQSFPALLSPPEGGIAAAIGRLPGVPNTDKDWLASAAVGEKGAGLLVTGWSYRYFARHLQESLRRQLQGDAMRKNESGKMPIVYVALFDDSGVYSAPTTPDVDEKALLQLELSTRTSGGAVSGQLTIESRTFGFAAAPVAALGEAVGIAVLRSEI